MGSCFRNIRTKDYYNLQILLHIPVSALAVLQQLLPPFGTPFLLINIRKRVSRCCYHHISKARFSNVAFRPSQCSIPPLRRRFGGFSLILIQIHFLTQLTYLLTYSLTYLRTGDRKWLNVKADIGKRYETLAALVTSRPARTGCLTMQPGLPLN